MLQIRGIIMKNSSLHSDLKYCRQKRRRGTRTGLQERGASLYGGNDGALRAAHPDRQLPSHRSRPPGADSEPISEVSLSDPVLVLRTPSPSFSIPTCFAMPTIKAAMHVRMHRLYNPYWPCIYTIPCGDTPGSIMGAPKD